jgi:hypothetical protein
MDRDITDVAYPHISTNILCDKSGNSNPGTNREILYFVGTIGEVWVILNVIFDPSVIKVRLPLFSSVKYNIA